MTFNHLKTNCRKFAHYRLKIRKVFEFFDFQPSIQHPLFGTKNKSFRTNYKKKSGSQNLLLKFLKFPQMQLLQLFENNKNRKNNLKFGQNWQFYWSIKQLITFEIVMNLLSGRNF